AVGIARDDEALLLRAARMNAFFEGWELDIDLRTVQRALDAEDLEGLLGLGAPADEYQSEAKTIAARLNALSGQPSEDHVTKIAEAVCVEMFGPFDEEGSAVRLPIYRRVAKRILGAL